MGCTALTLTHLRGQVLRAAWTFEATVDGVLTLVDPDSVRLRVKVGAAGVPTVYVYGVDVNLERDAAGTYHLDIDTSAAAVDATWYVRAEGSGTYAGAAEVDFNVDAGGFV